ncbi:hypothetical protein ZWY2020_040675 [Hordeum vulgare]|nr:hypothetical protein ZWY2020_040675 [Hordeum vulgare]
MDLSTLSCLLPPLLPRRRPACAETTRAPAGRGVRAGAWSNGAGTRRAGGTAAVGCAWRLCSATEEEEEDGFRAVMRIVKLNSAIQNRSVRELLELLADECRYFFRNVPPVSASEMSKSVFLFLHEMMLRHQVSFVLKPAVNGGFDLGVKWSLEWKGKKLPWDVDCTVSTTHVYTGLLLVSQVNKACGPLLQRILQMIYQNLDAVVLIVANKFLPEGTLDEERSNIIVCAIIGLVVMVLFYAIFTNL